MSTPTAVTAVIIGPDGTPYINAAVKAFSTTSPNIYQTTTDVYGNMIPLSLPPDTYDFEVSTPGVIEPMGLGAQQFTAFSVAISGTTQDISASLLSAALQLLIGITECQRVTGINVYVGQNFSAVVSDAYEIGLGYTTEIMAAGTLEVL